MTTNRNRLADVVARRHGLTAEERVELVGSTLAQLASHAEHLLARRRAVEAGLARNPEVPAHVYEGRFEAAAGYKPDRGAGRRVAAEMLAERVNGGDPETQAVFTDVAQRTLARGRPRHESDEDRQLRITERLHALGLGLNVED